MAAASSVRCIVLSGAIVLFLYDHRPYADDRPHVEKRRRPWRQRKRKREIERESKDTDR